MKPIVGCVSQLSAKTPSHTWEAVIAEGEGMKGNPSRLHSAMNARMERDSAFVTSVMRHLCLSSASVENEQLPVLLDLASKSCRGSTKGNKD